MKLILVVLAVRLVLEKWFRKTDETKNDKATTIENNRHPAEFRLR